MLLKQLNESWKSRSSFKTEMDKAYSDYRTKHNSSSMALMTRAEFAKDQMSRTKDAPVKIKTAFDSKYSETQIRSLYFKALKSKPSASWWSKWEKWNASQKQAIWDTLLEVFLSKSNIKEAQINERDDREDDEHGGGPTPWQNPDKGWKPEDNQMTRAQVAQALKTYKHDLQVALKNGESKAGMARIRAKIEELEAMNNS